MKQIILLIGVAIAVMSCASFYDVNVTTPPKTYVKPLTIDQNFDISGRFIIKQESKNNYGNFTWVRNNDYEQLNFTTPIGQTVARITIESSLATLTTQDNKTFSGDDLDDLMDDKLGFVLPLNYLHYWIQGVNLPNEPVESKLDNGFMQLGWKVNYLEWTDPNHPKIVECTKDDLTIKLLINW
ncbi:MAG: lipoprotein insertase outer membrane protein LolB [Burkholderiales bacterium]|nr:lipoprotein insertase outer membrane protein LolB [Burkholderiales bacterium]